MISTQRLRKNTSCGPGCGPMRLVAGWLVVIGWLFRLRQVELHLRVEVYASAEFGHVLPCAKFSRDIGHCLAEGRMRVFVEALVDNGVKRLGFLDDFFTLSG